MPLHLLVVVLLLLFLLVLGAATLGAWLLAAHWAPPRGDYPVQGVYLDSHEERATWPTMHATGVDFAYLLATTGSDARDPDFQRRLAAAQNANVRVGAVHRFDLCRLAGDQAGSGAAVDAAMKDGFTPLFNAAQNRKT